MVVFVRVAVVAAVDAFELAAPAPLALEDDVVVVAAAVGRGAAVADLDSFVVADGRGGAGSRTGWGRGALEAWWINSSVEYLQFFWMREGKKGTMVDVAVMGDDFLHDRWAHDGFGFSK